MALQDNLTIALIVGSLITGCFFGRDARRDLQELAAGGASAGAIALGKTGAAALRGSPARILDLIGSVFEQLASRRSQQGR